jgi:protoporphyrinogen oxidase
MLENLVPDGARSLREIEFASNVSVSIGYDRSAVRHELTASGFVVDAKDELEGLRACAFCSSKLPGRAPEGRVLLRAFFRPELQRIKEADSIWSERATRLLGAALGITRPPLATWVARWPEALPQYAANHRATIESIATRLKDKGRGYFAGTSFFPSGVPGAVRSGREAARAVLTG